MSHIYEFTAEVEIFPQKGGWHYIQVPLEVSEPLEIYADRGLIAVTATVGTSIWETSLLPKGDQTHFLALPAKIRKANKIEVADQIKASFILRTR